METDEMDCQRIADERLQADKVDLLYGEADAEVKERVERHLASCAACREELAGLGRLREELQAWRLPKPRPASTPRGVVVPRWLLAAAALLFGISLPLGASGYLSLQRALGEQRARADALAQQQQRTALALQQALAQARPTAPDAQQLQALVDEQLARRLRASEERQREQLDLRLAEWRARADAQRRVDLARVADGLRYLDGRHGQQLARTNALMSYVLDSTSQPR